jgi:hypothetical protein
MAVMPIATLNSAAATTNIDASWSLIHWLAREPKEEASGGSWQRK